MHNAILLLRLAPALTMVIFGLHQWVKPGDWLHYIPAWATKSSPMKPESSMRLHSLGNLAFGLFLASGWHPVLAVWVALVWWVSILPFAFRASWAICLRDLTITLGLVALLLLIR
jgi:hypothetical protein